MSKNDDLVRRLRPCPFCGAEASMRSGGPGCHFVQCDTCNATSDDHSEELAAEKWNRRHPDAIERGAAQGNDKSAIDSGESAAFEYAKTGGGPIGVFLAGLKAYRAALSTPPAPAPDAGEAHRWEQIPNANTDDAHPVNVLAGVLRCASGWMPEARIIGNVRAGDISQAIRAFDPSALAALATPQPPAVEAEAVEPVAWRTVGKRGDTMFRSSIHEIEGNANKVAMHPLTPARSCEPLYSKAALKAKADENERLRRERSQLMIEVEQMRAGFSIQVEKAEAAEARKKALREGLEPFADAASVVPGLRDEDECGVAGSYPPEGFKGRITVGDLRRARALLSEAGGE